MSASSNAHSAPSRKRRRPPVVCTECRRRKSACDRKNPCAQCIQYDLTCVYQNSQSAPRHPAHGLPLEPVASVTTNTSSEHSSIPVRASDETAANVTLPCDQAISEAGFQQSTPLVSNCGVPAEGALNDATFPMLGAILTPSVTASSSTLGAIDKGVGLSRSQTRARNNPDETLVQSGNILPEQNGQTSGLKGRYLKSRLFGQSHWMNSCFQFEEVMRANNTSLFSASPSITELLEKCKGLSSQLKASRPLSTPLDLRTCIPSKELCHQLKQAYFRTFEGVFRILHVPSFERDYDQYWEDPQVASESFLVRLLLVVAIGTCFHTGPTTFGQSLHESSAQWILVANMYLSGPVEKRRLNLGSVQNYCLLLLALQTNAVGGDLTWITAGSLVRTAMSVGLHRDPVYFPHMTGLQTELRRRLWYTTLEIAVQASLDSGMPPLISCSDYDCEPPSNLDDFQVDEHSTSAPQAESDAMFTETSMLRMLARSVPLRIETARILNGLHSDTSYQATIALGEKLTQACRANSTSFQAFNDTGSLDHKRPSAFAIKMVDTLCRRFLLSLHTPFAHKAAIDYTYHYSRKVCLDASLLLLSYATVSPAPSPQAQLDEFTRLRLVGRGMYRSVLLNAAATVCVEVITDLREDSSPWTSVTSNDPRSEALRDVVAVTWQRMQSGETSVKAHVGFVCALAQIEALQAGVSVEEATMDAALKSLKSCHAVLETRVKETGSLAGENVLSLHGGLDFDSGLDQGPLTDYFDANLDYSLDDDRWLSSLWLDE